MNKRILPLLFIVFTIVPNIVFATEPYEYLSDVIESLGICKIAEGRIKETDQQDNYSFMKGLRVFANEINRAKLTIERHTNSKNDLIREGARTYYNIYRAIVANKEEYLSFLEEKLNNPADAASKQGTWLRRESEIGAKNEALWRMLIETTAAATSSLLDMNLLKMGKTGYISITKKEKDSLTSKLKSKFGNDLPIGLKAGQYPIDASASTILEFLSDAWKTSDSK